MARNGAGSYSLPSGNPVVTGTVISSSTHNTTMSDLATAVTQSLAYDGQTVPVANLPMGGFKHTGVGNAAARTDYAATGQVQDGSLVWCGTAGGTANALTLSTTPSITAYVAGQSFKFKSGSSPNTGATTVAISGLAAIAVQSNGAACAGNEILADKWYEVVVDASLTSCQLDKIGGGLVAATSTEIKTGTEAIKPVTPASLLAAQGFTARYGSGNQTITAAGLLTLAHGLGREPIVVITWLKCLTAEFGYSVGDKLLIPGVISASTTDDRAHSIVVTSTNISIRFGAQPTTYTALNKTTGAGVSLTNANWALIVEAFA